MTDQERSTKTRHECPIHPGWPILNVRAGGGGDVAEIWKCPACLWDQLAAVEAERDLLREHAHPEVLRPMIQPLKDAHFTVAAAVFENLIRIQSGRAARTVSCGECERKAGENERLREALKDIVNRATIVVGEPHAAIGDIVDLAAAALADAAPGAKPGRTVAMGSPFNHRGLPDCHKCHGAGYYEDVKIPGGIHDCDWGAPKPSDPGPRRMQGNFKDEAGWIATDGLGHSVEHDERDVCAAWGCIPVESKEGE